MEFKCWWVKEPWLNCLAFFFFFFSTKWPSTFHLNPKRNSQNTTFLHGCNDQKWKDLTFHSLSSLNTPLRGHAFETSLGFTTLFPGSSSFDIATGCRRLCFLFPACLLVPSTSRILLLFQKELLLTRWVFWAFTSLLFIYFDPQAYSMCTVVWIVMNFGFSSRMSKACFQLNKPNEVKSFIPLLLYSHYPSQQGGWVKNASSRSWKNF